MKIHVRKYEHGWLTSTKWQIVVYEDIKTAEYFYGRTYEKARAEFNVWFSEQMSPLPANLVNSNQWEFDDENHSES